jgi:hypothetical protein
VTVHAPTNEHGRLERVAEALLLFRISNRRLDVFATTLTALLVFVSRFAYLANGPWEWDETLFARGILHFELAAHFPHPPGFPGWLAIGHLLTPLTGDPLVALQLASASFSVIALWVLATLGRRVATPAVAVAAALVVLAAPGPWLYSVRGFSSTAAAVLALGAGAVAVGGLRGRRLSAFTLLVTAAFLVRPILLPALAVLWVGVAWSVRPVRRLFPGVLAGIAAVVSAIVSMVWAEGGWSAFVAPFLTHGQRHFSRLTDNLGGYGDLGLVKGLGGGLPAAVLLAVAIMGIAIWARRVGRRTAVLWALVLVVAVSQLLWMQNRTTSRYAVGVQMALAPLIAAAASTLPPAAGCAGLLVAAGWLGFGSQPLVEEQHESQLPAWRAVVNARHEALNTGRTVVVESELHPFASYLWHLMERRGDPNPPRVLSPWDPEPWTGIDGAWLVVTVHRQFYPQGLWGREEHWGGVSDRLHPLTQERFLEAWLIEDPPLPVHGWWPGEKLPGGQRFMWGGADAELALPRQDDKTEIAVGVRPAPGPDPLIVRLNDIEVATIEGSAAKRHVWSGPHLSMSAGSSRLLFDRARGYPPGGGDSRPLTVQLFGVQAFRRSPSWAGPVSHLWQREYLGIEIDGHYEAEHFEGAGEGMWLGPRAVLRIPAIPGRLQLQLWAPRPTPPETVIRGAGGAEAGPLEFGLRRQVFEVEVLPDEVLSGHLEIEISSVPYLPVDDGLPDRRELGVVIFALDFRHQYPES